MSGGNANDLTAVEVEARLSSNVKDRDRGSRRKRKHSPDEVSGAAALSPSEESCASPIDPLSDLYAVLEGSALIPFLESKLQANSFLEICNHATVYRYVVYIIKELGNLLFIMVILNVNRYFNQSVFVRKKGHAKTFKNDLFLRTCCFLFNFSRPTMSHLSPWTFARPNDFIALFTVMFGKSSSYPS